MSIRILPDHGGTSPKDSSHSLIPVTTEKPIRKTRLNLSGRTHQKSVKSPEHYSSAFDSFTGQPVFLRLLAIV